MTKPVRLDEVAEQEVLDAKRWYENDDVRQAVELLDAEGSMRRRS